MKPFKHLLFGALFLLTTLQSYALIWSSGNANVAKIYSIEYPSITDVGAVITINGTGFVSSTRILIGGVAAITWNILSATKMTAVIPTPSNLGTYTKDVTLLSQADNKVNDLLYRHPIISSISPPTGDMLGGTVVTITGTGFATNANLFISGNAATNVHYIDSTQITATIPASIPANSIGNAPITVINPSGFSGQATGVFAYVFVPFATGGTITEASGYRIHTFTSSGTFTVNRAGNVEVLVVAGGGSGGNVYGGGGGGGGVSLVTTYPITSSVSVIVGMGGIRGAEDGAPGGNSSFGTITSLGGGGGGYYGGHQCACPNKTAPNGGSGGGGGGTSWYGCANGGSGLQPAQTWGGYGTGGAQSITFMGGGGGGAGNAATTPTGGSGFQVWGTLYGGGGGGGGTCSPTYGSRSVGLGGSGGGGRGAGDSTGACGYPSCQPVSGLENTGGGGGGNGSCSADTSSTGGSGIVIVRYPIGQ